MLPDGIRLFVKTLDEGISFACDEDRATVEKLGIKSESRYRESLAGRGMVRMALTTALLHDRHGAPYVNLDGVYISLSHSRNMIALAVSDRGPIGVDMEYPREQLYRVASKFLSPEEYLRYRTLPDLLRAWTAKEAIFKAASMPGLTISEVILPDLSIGKIAPPDDYSGDAPVGKSNQSSHSCHKIFSLYSPCLYPAFPYALTLAIAEPTC